jgi:hypothetical protein
MRSATNETIGRRAPVGRTAGTGREARLYVVLQLEEAGEILIEAVRPEMWVGFGVDELGVDAYPAPVALDRAFKHVADAEAP